MKTSSNSAQRGPTLNPVTHSVDPVTVPGDEQIQQCTRAQHVQP